MNTTNRKILIWIISAALIVAAVFGIWYTINAGGQKQNETEEIINDWSIVRDGESNGLGFETGFLTEYDGYHSHR